MTLIGLLARTRLRETSDFINYKYKLQKNKLYTNDKVSKKTILAYFFSEFHFPIVGYIVYLYLGDFMKQHLGLTPQEVIDHNLKIAIFIVLGVLIVAYLAKKVHPIRTAMVMAIFFCTLLPFIPYCLNILSNIGNESALLPLFLLQCAIYSFSFSTGGTLDSVQFKYFPVKKRFTYIATIFGISNPLSRVLAVFSLIPLTHYFGYYSLWFILIPAVIGYCWSLYWFKTLEIKSGNYYHYPYKDEDVEKDIYTYNYELGKEYNSYQKECKYSKRLINMLESINKTAKKEVNIKLVKKAIAFAKRWHDGQKRKTGEPYYTHPLAVAVMTAQYKFKTHMVVAAILHDVVEDSKCTVELISKEFTPRIAKIVELLTREYKGKKLSIAETIKRIFVAEDYEALLIKGLDRVHNLQTIHGMKSKKQKEIAEETIYEIANVAAYAVDDLNIHDKKKLEKKLYKLSNRTLKKNRI